MKLVKLYMKFTIAKAIYFSAAKKFKSNQFET